MIRRARAACAVPLAILFVLLAAQGVAHAAAGSGTGVATPAVSASPLAANGFTSPSCANAQLFASLSSSAQADCEVSGVAVAAVPLSNYAFDKNIPSVLDASVAQDADSIVQELVLTPVWTALVWLVHVAVIALEWCYSIDLLAPNVLAAASHSLASATRIFTDPWLGLVLALAAIGFAWQGLIRRRVIETAGQAALMAAMMLTGLWIIADPAGTVGAIGHLADDAALGTLSASTSGSVSRPVAGLEDALAPVFTTAISGPWCYLEFGDVQWCRDPSRLDPRLRAVAWQLEQIYHAGAVCHDPPRSLGLVKCAPNGSAEQRALAGASLALSRARTNGELFLALPADVAARNALVGPTATATLYGTLCGGADATACTASTAPQAQFRTDSGTWQRAGGLLLIAIGIAGMLATLGFLALRLLGAALATLLFLLLAPLAVLAPALGEAGRATFRLWLARLLGATLAKLLYTIFLGIALLILRLLSGLDSLGWWTQWLLVTVFWWTAFEHRHRLLALAFGDGGAALRRAPPVSHVRTVTRAGLASGALAAAAAVRASHVAAGVPELVRRVRSFPDEHDGGPASPLARALPGREPRGAAGARIELDAQARRVLADQRRDPVTGAPAAPEALAELRARRDRLLAARQALGERGRPATGNGAPPRARRRAISLERRAEQLSRALVETGGAGRRLSAPRLGDGRAPGAVPSESAVRRWGRILDREALRPAAQRRHASVAPLAGLSPHAYETAEPAQRRRAQLAIDRELDRRREWLERPGARTPARLRRVTESIADAAREASRAATLPPVRPRELGRRARQFARREPEP